MRVIKRDGSIEDADIKKIINDLNLLCDEDHGPGIGSINKKNIDLEEVAREVYGGLADSIGTQHVAKLTAQRVANRTSMHYDHDKLAARIAITSLHKRTKDSRMFSQVTEKLRSAVHPATGESAPIVSEEYYETVMRNAVKLDGAIKDTRDFYFSYFGISTLEASYLLRIGMDVVETPQQMFMRVAVNIHGNNIKAVLETYDLMSQHFFIHASPTLFNAGTVRPQLSSCFLQALHEDSIEGLMKTLSDFTSISCLSGGVGLHVHNMRCKGSAIHSSGGTASGPIAAMKIFNQTLRFLNGGKRKCALAVYVEVWHNDVIDIIECRKNTGDEDSKAREIFPALWIPNEFMRRVKNDEMWTLMCPKECPGLSDVHSEEFDELYKHYEALGKGRTKIRARELYRKIINTKIETGTPFIGFKDTINKLSNQQNIGTIKSSNLCTEIVQYSGPNDTAVCNLGSVALNRFLKPTASPCLLSQFDFDSLKQVVKVLVRNLDRVIDVTYYPTDECRISNQKTRPLGLGVQGLADLFLALRTPFDSEDAKVLNRKIFEAIYFAALEASCELAEKHGPYEYYEGSPISKGMLQFDMFKAINEKTAKRVENFMKEESAQDWDTLREKIKKHGVRNSMVVAPMPTASTAQILGNSESFEPYTSNIFTRNVSCGIFQVTNKVLIDTLVGLGLWNKTIRDKILQDFGSVSGIASIDEKTKKIFRTVWEIKPESLLDMVIDRAMFVDQSQSYNQYIREPNFKNVGDLTAQAWLAGGKTIYYTRTPGPARPVLFTIDRENIKKFEQEDDAVRDRTVCFKENKDDCMACSG
nr:MAG: wsv172-like protein [Metapenaeus ensis nimavirus]